MKKHLRGLSALIPDSYVQGKEMEKYTSLRACNVIRASRPKSGGFWHLKALFG